MSEYRVTFGQRFRHDQHQKFRDAHPDGWVTILARDYDHAHAIAMAALGTEWSGLYEADEIGTDVLPRGELLRLDGTGEALIADA